MNVLYGGAEPDGSIRRGVGADLGAGVCGGGAVGGARGRVNNEVDGEMTDKKILDVT